MKQINEKGPEALAFGLAMLGLVLIVLDAIIRQ